MNFKKFFGRILAPPFGRRPGAAAPSCPPPRYATVPPCSNLLFILMLLLFTGISDGIFLERWSLGGVYQFRAVLIYAGPFRCRELNVSTIRLYTARLFIGSQCSFSNIGEMCSCFLVLEMILAAEF